MKPSRSRNLEEALSETDTLVRLLCVCVYGGVNRDVSLLTITLMRGICCHRHHETDCEKESDEEAPDCVCDFYVGANGSGAFC